MLSLYLPLYKAHQSLQEKNDLLQKENETLKEEIKLLRIVKGHIRFKAELDETTAKLAKLVEYVKEIEDNDSQVRPEFSF